jgi:hypothetical protein
LGVLSLTWLQEAAWLAQPDSNAHSSIATDDNLAAAAGAAAAAAAVAAAAAAVDVDDVAGVENLCSADAEDRNQLDTQPTADDAAAAAADSEQLPVAEEADVMQVDTQQQQQDDDDAATHARFMQHLQQIQQRRQPDADAQQQQQQQQPHVLHGAAKRKQGLAGRAAPAAVAAAASAAEQQPRSKRQRNMTSRAAEAAAAGLIPAAGRIPADVLAVVAEMARRPLPTLTAPEQPPQLQQQQQLWQSDQGGYSSAPVFAAAAGGQVSDALTVQVSREVALLSSSELGVVMDALDRLFRLLTSLMESGDARADAAMGIALRGLVALLSRQHHSSSSSEGWADTQLTALTVLQAMALQSAAYREAITAAGAVVPLVRLMQGPGSEAVQVAAVQALQALVVAGSVGGIVAAGGLAVLQELAGCLSPGGELWGAVRACLASIAAAQ